MVKFFRGTKLNRFKVEDVVAIVPADNEEMPSIIVSEMHGNIIQFPSEYPPTVIMQEFQRVTDDTLTLVEEFTWARASSVCHLVDMGEKTRIWFVGRESSYHIEVDKAVDKVTEILESCNATS